MRVGCGYDSHRFDPTRPLVLGGVTIPDHAGLAGHSDGDAVVHAVVDAVLGAAGIGDIGQLFPPDNAQWKDADSMNLLALAMERVRHHGWAVSNVDITVVCESPKISAFAPQMRQRLGDTLGVPVDAVSVKGKTNEGMGWIGSGEGLAVHSVALLSRSGVGTGAQPDGS